MKYFQTFFTYAVLLVCSVVAYSFFDGSTAHAGAIGAASMPLLLGTVSMFETRTMLEALEQMFIPRTFLQTMFFKESVTFDTENVDLDVIKGKRRLAPFVSPLAEGKVVERTGFSTSSIKPPYIKQKMATKASDILKRQSGNIIYQGNSSPAQRAQVQLGKDMIELMNMIIRREEWMAANALNSGVITVAGDGINAQIDFLMASDHKITLTGTAKWTDAASDPITNLRTWKQKAGQDSGLVPNVAVFGSSVLTAFLGNANALKLLDKTKVTLGQIDPKQLPDGVTYYGNVEGLDIYTYDEWYLDDNGALQPMVPVNKIFMGSTSAQNKRLYGAIQDLEATAAVPYFPKSWEEKDPSVRWLMLQSAPVVALNQPDAFMSIQPID